VHGQLGIGSASIAQNSPQQVAGSGWVSIAAGGAHACATRYFPISQPGHNTGQTLWCWGDNGDGQLGIGSTTNQSSPVELDGDSFWVAVTAGGFHTCAIGVDRSLWCWGYNAYGQVGIGNTITPQRSPQLVW